MPDAATPRSATALTTSPARRPGFLRWLLSPARRGPFLVAPAIGTLVVVNIFPLMWSYGLSFFAYKANRHRHSAALDRTGQLPRPVCRTRSLGPLHRTPRSSSSAACSLQLVIGFLLALLFSKEFPLRRYLLMLVLAPMMLSLSAVGVFFKLFYDPTLGFIPRFVQLFTGEPFVILDTPLKATIGIVCADAWMWSPFVMLLVLAGLVSRAEVSLRGGGDRSRQRLAAFPHHHFPLHQSLLLLALLFRTIETFKLFDVVYILTEGGPGSSTETISVYLYRVAFNYFQTGRASALGYILLFAVIVLTSLYLYAIQARRTEALQ